MKTALSNEFLENCNKFFKKWNEKVDTHDDRHTQEIMKEMILGASVRINLILGKWEKKVMDKYPNDNEKAVEEMFKIKENEDYKALKKISDNLLYTHYQIEHLYELKNRKSAENIKLRAQNAKLKLGEI